MAMNYYPMAERYTFLHYVVCLSGSLAGWSVIRDRRFLKTIATSLTVAALQQATLEILYWVRVHVTAVDTHDEFLALSAFYSFFFVWVGALVALSLGAIFFFVPLRRRATPERRP